MRAPGVVAATCRGRSAPTSQASERHGSVGCEGTGCERGVRELGAGEAAWVETRAGGSAHAK